MSILSKEDTLKSELSAILLLKIQMILNCHAFREADITTIWLKIDPSDIKVTEPLW